MTDEYGGEGKRNGRIKDDFSLGLSNLLYGGMAIYEKYRRRIRFRRENQFSFGHAEFEIPV